MTRLRRCAICCGHHTQQAVRLGICLAPASAAAAAAAPLAPAAAGHHGPANGVWRCAVCGDMSKRHYYRTHAFGVCPAAREALRLGVEQGEQMARPMDPSLPGGGDFDIDPDCGSAGDRDGLGPAPVAESDHAGPRGDSPLSAANFHTAESRSAHNGYAYAEELKYTCLTQ
jgi:hypothetical protein